MEQIIQFVKKSQCSFSELKSRQVYSADTAPTGQMKLFKAPIVKVTQVIFVQKYFLVKVLHFNVLRFSPYFGKGYQRIREVSEVTEVYATLVENTIR